MLASCTAPNPAFDADGGGNEASGSTAGDPMVGGVLAPAARVGLGFDVDGNGTTNSTADLTPQGVQMFVAAVEWCMK